MCPSVSVTSCVHMCECSFVNHIQGTGEGKHDSIFQSVFSLLCDTSLPRCFGKFETGVPTKTRLLAAEKAFAPNVTLKRTPETTAPIRILIFAKTNIYDKKGNEYYRVLSNLLWHVEARIPFFEYLGCGRKIPFRSGAKHMQTLLEERWYRIYVDIYACRMYGMTNGSTRAGLSFNAPAGSSRFLTQNNSW